MNIRFLLLALPAVAMLTGSDGVRLQDGPTLRIPEGQSLLLLVRAEGVQIYGATLKASSPAAYEWRLKAPRATLFDQDHKKVGAHTAGPTWELNDGSKVVGAQPPMQRVDSANADNVAWLLLEAKSHEGTGLLSRVTYILRVDTSGGIAPAKLPTKDGQEVQVKYRATYLFLAADRTRLAFVSDRTGDAEIYVMNADGSGVTRITTGRGNECPTWSPDRSKIAFMGQGNTKGPGPFIYAINADGTGLKQLTRSQDEAWSASWSPDGRKIAFEGALNVVRDSKGFPDTNTDLGIYVMNVDGTGGKRISKDGKHDRLPAWSPDGAKIAFYGNRNGINGIYVMNADGSGEKCLSTIGAGKPAWSPDGKRLAFEGYGGIIHEPGGGNDMRVIEIYVIGFDGSGQAQLTETNVRFVTPSGSQAGVSNGCPTWSADGKQIAFESNRDSDFTPNGGYKFNTDIYVMNVDGSGIRRVTNNPAADGEPAW